MTSAPCPDGPTGEQAIGYWAESRRPMTSLLFITPLLVVYEVGIVVLGPAALRNGADLWLRELLRLVGFGQYFLLPALTVGILVSWHHTTGKPWRLTRGVFSGMIAECILLALSLRLLLEAQTALFEAVAGPLAAGATTPALAPDAPGVVRESVAFLGAGVYEELLFRLMLLPAVGWTLNHLGIPRRTSLILAVFFTSLVFAAAHYVGGQGETFQWAALAFWFGFCFRFLAGLFFSALFLHRGFGVAAGTHAGYDILVGLF
jgi:membrane protease YdiL (CAAX protease family)